MAFDPFKVATWWTGMCLGIPMLATELAAEIWRPAPKPAPVTAELTQKPAEGLTRDVAEIRTRFTSDGLDDVVKAAKRARKKKAA